MDVRFNIGDRVMVVDKNDYEAECVLCMTGTIVAFESIRRSGVRFDEKFAAGHDLNGNCERGYGRWVDNKSMVLIDDSIPDDLDVSDDDLSSVLICSREELTPDDPLAGMFFHSTIREEPNLEGRRVVRTVRPFGRRSSTTKFVVKFDGVREYQTVDESELVVSYGNKKRRRVS